MSNVPEKHRHLESLSPAEIEREVLKLRTINPAELSDEQLDLAVSLHAIATRKTSGPPKTRAAKAEPFDLGSLEL